MKKKNCHFSIVEKAYKKHSDWINILKSFGCPEELAKDLTQEMYIQLQIQTENGLDITFDDDVNYYYIYKMLKGMYLNYHKVESRMRRVPIESIDENDIKKAYKIDEQEYAKMSDNLQQELKDMYWYDKKVFTIVASGTSISQLSRESKISYYSLYNTYKNVKEYLKNKLQ